MTTGTPERGLNIKNIRTYVIGLIYRHGFSSVRVPSSMELAERFGVTRRTARIVLEGLIAEGWLIGRNGVGTFTNPKCGFKVGSTPQMPLVALSFNCGSYFYYDLYSGKIYAECMRALLEANFNVYPAIHVPHTPGTLAHELDNAGVDAGVFCYPEEPGDSIRAFIASGRPCVTIKSPLPGADCVQFDYRNIISALAQEAAEKEYRHVTFCRSVGPFYSYLPELCERFAAVAPKTRIEIIDVTPSTYEARLDEIFARKTLLPDLLFIGWRAPVAARNARIRYNVPKDRCKIIVDDEFVVPTDFTGRIFAIDKAAAAAAAAELLRRRLCDPSLPPEQSISVEGILKSYPEFISNLSCQAEGKEVCPKKNRE
ncbi:MAG: GntR family transcriptional regulator [Victivallaceae bacterium]|nr:GntR family transcriptional regulator [Victivallaceae bacterium]